MAGKVVLFGASGFTGRLTATAMVRRGLAPLLAGRNPSRVAEVAGELGGLPTAVADAAEPTSIAALVARGDVLVSTVGPFTRFGAAALEAAIGAGATYLDSTGEPPFIRRVFEQGRTAERAGCGLIPAFGFDYVPGNLAGALALAAAPDATRVDVGYFVTGDHGLGGISAGTRASASGVLLASSYAWRGGRLVEERPARRMRASPGRGRTITGLSVGGSEHFGLPQLAPGLRDVNVYLGWTGPGARAVRLGAAVASVLVHLPATGPLLDGVMWRLARGSSGGPSPARRARTRSRAVAAAYDAAGAHLASVTLEGPSPYDLTAELLAWGAHRALESGLAGSGALGPVAAFGLAGLERGCAEVGLTQRL